ncbi:MAG: M23 family metallopeptidase [Bacteroidales bacterium]|nr:M23 family metallopeptidase [Bacteroidales bacterium]
MADQNPYDDKVTRFRVVISDNKSHKQLWIKSFSRASLFVAAVSVCVVTFILMFCLIAFTPVRNFVPGYPDSHSRREAIRNAMRVDSLETVISRWEFYSENLRRVVDGEDPVKLDTLVRMASELNESDLAAYAKADTLLRHTVLEEDQFGLSNSVRRKLPVEGLHFFTPVKGVVLQGFDPVTHPFVDITPSANAAVCSVLEGTVISAGWSDEYGYTLVVQHEDDVVSIYRHCARLTCKSGDKVSAGQSIAMVGTGAAVSTGDHLQFELWYSGEAVDPLLYIKI